MGQQQVGPPALPPTDCDSSSQRDSPWEPPTLRPAAPRSLEAGVVLRKASGSVHRGSGDPEGETSAPGGGGAGRQTGRRPGASESKLGQSPAALTCPCVQHRTFGKTLLALPRVLILMRPGWSES